MTFSQVLIDTTGIDQLAEGMLGFSDDAQEVLSQTVMTTLFISGASSSSNGRCSYLLMDDGSRLWVPNSLTCWLVDASIITQTYENYDPVDKLLIRVIASDGSSYIYRCGLDSWAASSFLSCLRHLSKEQLAEPIQITLTAKGRATFASVAYKDGESFTRVAIPQHQLSSKLTYEQALAVISYINGTTHDNEDAPETMEQTERAATDGIEPMEAATVELDELLTETREAS